jgi:hypothetical protein
MATKSKKKHESQKALVRAELRPIPEKREAALGAVVRRRVPLECDCRALSAFHAWRDEPLPPSFNVSIDFNPAWGIPPAGKRAVIELVTATIVVPSGEFARLRMFTSLGSAASNLDLTLTPQGQFGGKQILSCTHAIRAYSDSLVDFNVNRDNAQTKGSAFICISGYLVDA